MIVHLQCCQANFTSIFFRILGSSWMGSLWVWSISFFFLHLLVRVFLLLLILCLLFSLFVVLFGLFVLDHLLVDMVSILWFLRLVRSCWHGIHICIVLFLWVFLLFVLQHRFLVLLVSWIGICGCSSLLFYYYFSSSGQCYQANFFWLFSLFFF